ncbi:unnamed protein product [Sphagnum balticum]
MVKKTRTIVATIKEAKKIIGKKPRTSTIDATLASAASGFKQKKKPTKTRTIVETIKEASAKTKNVAKLPKKGKAARKAKGGKKGKAAKGN